MGQGHAGAVRGLGAIHHHVGVRADDLHALYPLGVQCSEQARTGDVTAEAVRFADVAIQAVARLGEHHLRVRAGEGEQRGVDRVVDDRGRLHQHVIGSGWRFRPPRATAPRPRLRPGWGWSHSHRVPAGRR
ncbi:hypothetical protein G6F68_017601 [Rhizopus microsporus]|nr:hypothetical protein G6F68_017601 [Rhizopus microsporus]